MQRFQALAVAAALLLSGSALAATDGSGLTAVAGSVVGRCYTVWATGSDADLVRLEETLRRELRAEAAASGAQADHAEAEIALLEGHLAFLNAGLGETVADAAAQKTVGTPTGSASALGKEILTGDAAAAAAEIAAMESELAEARARLAQASLKQLRMPAQESGLTRCIDYHRARMASAAVAPAVAPAVVPAAAVPAPAPAPAPAPQPAAAAPPPAPASAPEPAKAPELVAAAPEMPEPATWDGSLSGWYEGACESEGRPSYDFRQPFEFDVVFAGPVQGIVFWSNTPERAGYTMAGTTGHPVSGLMNADGTVIVTAAWMGTLLFDGTIDSGGNGQGSVVWERPYELCTGTWATD